MHYAFSSNVWPCIFNINSTNIRKCRCNGICRIILYICSTRYINNDTNRWKLGDLIGRRNIVVIPGIICIVCGVAFAFARSLVALMSLRLLISLAQGAFTAAPYIIMGLINERKDVPKAMGMLAAAVAVGGFGGSIVAGILTDMNMLTVAIIMPAAPLLIGIILIGINMPNQKREGKVTIDVPGIIALVVTLCAILLSLNFGSSIGWGHPTIIAGFVLGIVAFYALIKIESKAKRATYTSYIIQK